MKTINFKQFEVFTDITKKNTAKTDVSMAIADAIYKQAMGIMAHSVALRIYESNGEIELSPEEAAFLGRFIRENTTPLFQDSFESNLTDK